MKDMDTKLFVLSVVLLLCQCKSTNLGSEGIALENTYWRLSEVAGNPVTTPPNGKEVYMTLTQVDGQRRLQGHAGCNGLGGDYKVEGDTIEFQVITTRMFCEAQMEVENKFTQMLTMANSYKITGRTLELYASGQLLGRFEAKD